ncbi:MAG: TRAM domain-containing protein [Thermodesulfovibrionales bacterium]|nr:TRAM domain-containing protein [Thermodesulfovibrionales bacterium]
MKLFVILRALIVSVFLVFGYLAGGRFDFPLAGGIAGILLGIAAVSMELALKRLHVGSIIGGVVGLSLGIFSATLMLYPLKAIIPEGFGGIVSFVVGAVLGYGGLLSGLKKGEKLTVSDLFRSLKGQGGEGNLKLLDTSVIIDGRIADVCETGFLEGGFIVPQFILQELQHIADSPDSLKRARGRRGLDILHRIQKMAHITVKIVDEDFPKIKEVDAKLVALGKAMNAKVITNDFNLNKVAELQGVSVLNINELANAIKPVVLPGETLRVFIIKEGKEHNQGVAYLDDGTMVVVDNGRKLIGKNAEVTVTSVLQTTAGRMIFTKLKEDYEREERAGK